MISFRIEKIDETASTNTLAMARARQGEPEGLVIVAGHQTAGRGKPGRKWLSPVGKNLLCSILLRPPVTPSQAPMLTLVACRAVARVLKEKYDIVSEFKRPNDVMVGTRKICGTLVEAISSHSKLEAVVVGIGLNVNADDSELPPEGISMRAIKSKDFSVDEVLDHILNEFSVNVHEMFENA